MNTKCTIQKQKQKNHAITMRNNIDDSILAIDLEVRENCSQDTQEKYARMHQNRKLALDSALLKIISLLQLMRYAHLSA